MDQETTLPTYSAPVQHLIDIVRRYFPMVEIGTELVSHDRENGMVLFRAHVTQREYIVSLGVVVESDQAVAWHAAAPRPVQVTLDAEGLTPLYPATPAGMKAAGTAIARNYGRSPGPDTLRMSATLDPHLPWVEAEEGALHKALLLFLGRNREDNPNAEGQPLQRERGKPAFEDR